MHRLLTLLPLVLATACMSAQEAGTADLEATQTEAITRSLVCCENGNGNAHPVSANGNATASCDNTWNIPAGEDAASFCGDGYSECYEATTTKQCTRTAAGTCVWDAELHYGGPR